MKINQFQFRSFLAKLPRLQPYFLAKIGSVSSLFNLQSKSINFNFGHFWPKYQGYSLTSWPKLAHFHHFSISNQNKSISISVICGQNTKAIALLFGQHWLIFITFQSPIKLNQFQFRSFLAKIPRLQPYFLAKIGSFSSLFNLQSNSINFNFGHFWPNYQGYSLTFWPTLAHFHHFSISNQNQSISISVICGQNTKAIALLFGQNWLIFITFQSPIKINQFQFRSFLAKLPRLQPYFLAKIGSFSSLFNLQSKSINFNFGHFWPKYQGYSLTSWPKLAHFHHFSISNQNQSISISVIFGQNTKAIALLFGQNWLIFITFQSPIKINQFQFRSFLAKIPRLQPYFLAKIGSFSSLFNLQSKSINFNFGQFWPKYQGYSLTSWPKLAQFHHFSISNQNQSLSISVNFGQNTKAIALLFGQNWLSFITFQSPIKINQFQFRSFLAKIPRLQPYFLAKIGSISSLFNLQSKSINFNFGHFWPKYQGYSLTSWRKLAHFHHFSISNQNQSISISVIFGQNTKAIALRFGQNWLIFITFQSPMKINQFQFRSFLAKLPRLQPYFLAKIGSVSSLFNLQSKSINFNFGHFWPKYQGYSLTSWPKLAHFHHFSISNQNKSMSISVICGQNTKAIALLFGQHWLIFITFQSPIKLNQFQFRSFLAKIPRLQPYFLAKIGSFSSLFNLQSNSINFNFGHFWPNYQGYSLTFWPTLAHFHHFSISNQNQSISISVICGQNTKAIALLFGQNWLIFITFQSPIKINQFQFRSFLAKLPRLQPYFLARIGSFSSLFNLQSKSINFNFGHFWPKYQGYSLTFWPKLAHFHHFSISNQNQSMSISVIFGQNTKALVLGQNWLIFITFQSPIKINQFQFRSFLAKIPRLQPYFLAKIGSFSSLFNLQSNSINFNFGHFCQNTKAIALLLGENWLIFITFQSPIKINQFQFRSYLAKIPRLQPLVLAKIGSFSSLFNLQSKSINFNFGHFWPQFQGYSLTSWPKLAHFHHFSISNPNQSISSSVIFGQNTKAIALLVGQNWLIFITCQSPIKINQVQFRSFLAKIPRLQPYFLAKIGSVSSLFNLQSFSNQSISISVIFGQTTKAIALPFGQNWLIFITFQSPIKINQFQNFGYSLTSWRKLAQLIIINQNQSISFGSFLSAYSLTFSKLAHFHHSVNLNQNQSIKINQFQFRSFLAKIPRLQPYFLAKIGSFSSLFNLQSKSINFNFGHFWPKYQGYSLTSWPKLAHFHHFSISNQNQSISISVIFWPKYQGYSLTSWPKLAHFHHFSISNQNQSISISVIFGQNTKAIALLLGQNWLIFITFQSPIKINQFQFRSFLAKIPRLQPYFFGQNWLIFITFQSPIKINQFQFRSCLAKIPRLQPYFLAKIGSFSSLFNLQSKSINFNFGHFWPKYQGYSLTFWPKLAHFHHFSISNQNQSISISVIFGQNTKAIALLFGQNWLIFITFQSPIKINQFQFRSFLAKIPRLQPYFLAKIGSFSSLFNLQSKSINFNFGHFWPKYQGYSLTSWPKLAHFHHFSISNQNQSISISVIFGQNSKAIALLLGQNWLIFITFHSPIKINQFQFRSFLAKISKAIALLSWPKLAHFHHFSISNQNQSMSISVSFGQNTKAIALLSWPKLAHFHHFSISNQNQSISISVIFGQNTKAIALVLGQNWLIFITFQSPIKINQFQFRSFLAKIPRLQPSLVGQNWLKIITLQSPIKINQFQFRSFLAKIPRLQPYFLAKIGSFSSLFNLQSKSIKFNFGHFWPKYQGYSLTFWPKLAHFHHFSISNQNQSISISVMFGQNTKAIALLFGQNWLIFITFQSPIKINQFQFRSFLAKIPRLQPYFLAKIGSFSSLFNLQSKSINFNFESFLAKIPRLQPYFLAKIGSISSLFNLQSKSINFNFGHFWPKYQGYSLTSWPKLAHFHHFSISNQNQSISISVIFGQNTKAIALLFGQTWLIFITFQSTIKINQFQFRSFVPKYQGYSLSSWPKLAHFHHFSISNQNKSISLISVICGENTKAIALLLGQNWLIFITFQSPIKINQFQFRSFMAKIPRLQPYVLAKIGSFSSLVNLQSK